MIDAAQSIRDLKAAAQVPQRKPFYNIPKISKKREAQMLCDLPSSVTAAQDLYFEHHCANNLPICTNCGMEATWLLQEKYTPLWRACQAHILPKKKGQFPSLSANLDNHIVLFPSWGGHLCGCHNLYDSSWMNACKMNVWPVVVEIFKVKLYPLIPEWEKKNIPDQLIITL